MATGVPVISAATRPASRQSSLAKPGPIATSRTKERERSSSSLVDSFRRCSAGFLAIATLPFLASLAVSIIVSGCESSGVAGESGATQCRDGVDNDGDGYIDCLDQDCFEFVFCADGGNPDVVVDGVHAHGDGDEDVFGGDSGDTSVRSDEDSPAGDASDVATLSEDTRVPPDAVEGPPVISIESAAVDFGVVEVGGSVAQTVRIRNMGRDQLGIDRLVFDADAAFAIELDATEFEVSEETRSGVDLVPALSLSPGGRTDLTVRFAPAVGGIFEGAVELRSNDPTHEWAAVELRGGGAERGQPAIYLEPGDLAFGPRVVGREGVLALQILSRGTQSLVIDRLEFAEETSSPDFSIDLGGLRAEGERVTAENPLVIPPNGFVTFHVFYTPDVANAVDELTGEPVPDTGVLLVGNNSPQELVEVEASGYGVTRPRPHAVILCEEGDEVIPQTTLHLLGDQSYVPTPFGEIRRFEWRVEQPVGSQSSLMPSATFPNPTFEVNVAGTYVFHLDVWDQEDAKSSDPASYEVVVVPDEAIHLELLWTTPGDPDETDTGPFAGSDMDLHFIHPRGGSDPAVPDVDGDGNPDPYFEDRWDCYWFNPEPDWGAFGDEYRDNPSFDRDDTDGAGPENINLDVPESGKTYEVAAHYWNDHGYGPSSATVRVYIHQELVFEQADVLLETFDLWSVATIEWPGGDVTPVKGPDGAFDITPEYRHPLFFDD